MPKKIILKRAAVAVPGDRDEAAVFVRRIGETKREIEAFTGEFNARVEELRAKMMERVQPLEQLVTDTVEGLFAFAEARREELTDGGKRKTVELATGEIGWRTTPPRAIIRNPERAVEIFERMGLDRFVRVKKTPNKEAILAEPKVAQQVKGVSIRKRDEFFVRPAETELEVASDVKKLKRAIA